MIDIYTDGACSGNPGPGGWAAIVVQGDEQLELKGSAEGTTNNRMEIIATMEGLAQTPENAEVTIHSDSQYVVNTMTKNWKRNANRDLWQRLDDLASSRKVNWVWVKGHDGHPKNERADKLAVEMIGQTSNMPTHFDSTGQVHMVDVSEKQATERIAIAKGTVKMKPETLELIEKGQAAI
jgi:ribonuclease HI